MSRMQLALRVSDLGGSVAFYSTLFGVEVETIEQVTAATERFTAAGLATFEENDTSCCYALQDKVWVRGPGQEPWEVYVVKADSDILSPSKHPGSSGRCVLRHHALLTVRPRNHSSTIAP